MLTDAPLDAKQVLDQIKKHDITFAVQHAKQVLLLDIAVMMNDIYR